MAQIFDVIARLKSKTEIVINDNIRLTHRLQRSEQKVVELQQDKQELTEKLVALNERIRIFEMTGDFVNVSGGTKSARDRINKLIREIDQCISLMNK